MPDGTSWVWTFLLVLCAMAPPAMRGARAQAVGAAQDKKADGVFDEARPAGEKKPGDAKTPGATPKAGAVSNRDTIGFTQENVAAQMTELEERMFRLSEALRGLEPENASRLKLALNFSREELILLQMKETQKLLRDAELNKAETEVRELLAKLEHLRSLLLAEDLDFQMKLARLRQMRETLGQLDRIIKEERRELAWSRGAVAEQGVRKRLQGRRGELEALVRDQESIVRDLRAAIAEDGKTAPQEARDAAGKRQAAARKTAEGLAGDPVFAEAQPPFLQQADPHLGDALTSLATPDADAAADAAERGLGLFRKELERLVGRVEQAGRALDAAEFRRLEQDQARNRGATDALAETSARLGDSGVALQKDLIHAGAAMRSAEEALARVAAQPASEGQVEALKDLVKTREELARAVEGLLVELRSELQSRIISELTEMHEIQADIRETTQAQAPRVAQRSRTALVLVVGLSRKESELGDRTEHLRALVEETEFGIALPTTLRVLAREMRKVQEWLGQGDPSPRTVALEKRVEDDLLGLLEAIRRLPPTTPPPAGTPLPTDPRARERELNRLIAELKMIRLLQSRLNDDTVDVDHTHPSAAALSPELRREIEALKAQQEEIRNSIARLSERFEPPAEDQ
jgi:hypothetical protein